MFTIDAFAYNASNDRKKKSTQSAGASSNDIFGDLDEFSKVNKYDETSESKEAKVEDEFEPIINSETYMTKKDDQIKKTDIPERMQVFVLITYIRKVPIIHL